MRGQKWGRPCSAEGCERPAQSRGYCNTHYARWRKGKPLDAPLKYRRWQPCQVDGCEKARHSNGYCAMHWHRVKTGTPLTPGKLTRDQIRYNPTARRVKWGTPKASEVTYNGAHLRCRSIWGSPAQYPCIQCGNAARSWAYDGRDPEELLGATTPGTVCYYSAYPEFYMPMCAPCHRRRDAIVAVRELEEYRKIKHSTGLTFFHICRRLGTLETVLALLKSDERRRAA